jgi:hypothetical protein
VETGCVKETENKVVAIFRTQAEYHLTGREEAGSRDAA